MDEMLWRDAVAWLSRLADVIMAPYVNISTAAI
jgi:hypothetical protein